MIYDYENAFLFNQDVTDTPKVIDNGNEGNAYNESFLSAKFAVPLATAAVITLKTGNTEDVKDTMANLTIPAGKQHGSIRVPFGAKKFYGISLSGPTSGKCTVALTPDGELE